MANLLIGVPTSCYEGRSESALIDGACRMATATVVPNLWNLFDLARRASAKAI
jgi:hypothetical protein